MSWLSDATNWLGGQVGYPTLGSDVGGLFDFGSSTPSTTIASSTDSHSSIGDDLFKGAIGLGTSLLGNYYSAGAQQDSLAQQEALKEKYAQFEYGLGAADRAAKIKLEKAKIALMKKQLLKQAYDSWIQTKEAGAQNVGKAYGALTQATTGPLLMKNPYA